MSRKKFKNKKKISFLDSIPQTSIDSIADRLTLKSKFSFAYFNNTQEAGQDFSDWSHDELIKLFEKLKNYSEDSLEYWKNQKVGRYNLFAVYDSFPINTEFTHPKNVPHQAKWARFHLENRVRLIGFVLPDEYHDKVHDTTGIRFDNNTFYVVFLDKNHLFYKVNKK